MLGSFFTYLLYMLGIVDPHLRYAFQPVHILAAWTEAEGQISIQWSTGLPVWFSELKFRQKHCGVRGSDKDWKSVIPDYSVFYKYKAIFWEYIHTAIIDGLDERCTYEYQVGSGMFISEMKSISGRTPYYLYNPLKASHPASVIVLGDMGVGTNSTATRAFLKTYLDQHQEIAAILHVGDIAYDLDFTGGMVGDEYLSDMAGIADRIPYMVVPGNHEAAHNFTHYRNRFRMPVTPENQGTNFFYSFNLGPAHFVMYSTEVHKYNSYETQKNQMKWLRADLEAANKQRSLIPWVLTFGHKPQYCNVDWTRPLTSVPGFRSNGNCQVQSVGLRAYFEEIFYENGVDIVFAGHIHKYEREAAVYRNQTVLSELDGQHLHLNPNAAIHIVSGIAGSDHGRNPVSLTPQLWSRFECNSYGFGVLTVYNATHLYWQQFDAETQAQVDYLWIIKTRPRYKE